MLLLISLIDKHFSIKKSIPEVGKGNEQQPLGKCDIGDVGYGINACKPFWVAFNGVSSLLQREIFVKSTVSDVQQRNQTIEIFFENASRL